MARDNSLTINGVSTNDFDFKVHVLSNDGFRFPKKKNQLIETDYITGAIKKEVKAWPAIEKTYIIHCLTHDFKNLRQIKLWAKDYGRLVAADEPDVYYEILDVDIAHSTIDQLKGFELEVTFTVKPFGYEHETPVNTYYNGESLINHTNAPMFPRIKIIGNSNEQTGLTIGDQTIYLKNLVEAVTIECQYLEQNVLNQYDSPTNSIMRGEFFIIPEDSENEIRFEDGIERIEITERWGWL